MKAKKFIIWIVVGVLIAGAIASLCFYFYASEIRFDHCDADVYVDSADLDTLRESGCQMIYPFFGNSVSLTRGRHYSYPLGIGKGNETVYSTVNSVIHSWAEETVTTYQNRVNVGYSVQNDGKTLTVAFGGSVYPYGIDSEAVPIEKTFVFDIENAGVDNLPKLINE